MQVEGLHKASGLVKIFDLFLSGIKPELRVSKHGNSSMKTTQRRFKCLFFDFNSSVNIEKACIHVAAAGPM